MIEARTLGALLDRHLGMDAHRGGEALEELDDLRV